MSLVRTAILCKSCPASIPDADIAQFSYQLGSPDAGYICLRCRLAQRTQYNALEARINTDVQRCDGCHDDLTTIAARQNGSGSRFIHWKDGVYQFLCWRCSGNYAVANRQLYARTLWGYRNKLR